MCTSLIPPHHLHDCAPYACKCQSAENRLVCILTTAYRYFFAVFSSGAPRGMTLFPLLSLRILSPLRKTVGRNKGTAKPLYSLLYSYLCCKSCVCVCVYMRVCVCVCVCVWDSWRWCCNWLIINSLRVFIRCVHMFVCVFGTWCFPANEHPHLLLHERWLTERRDEWRWKETWRRCWRLSDYAQLLLFNIKWWEQWVRSAMDYKCLCKRVNIDDTRVCVKTKCMCSCE